MSLFVYSIVNVLQKSRGNFCFREASFRWEGIHILGMTFFKRALVSVKRMGQWRWGEPEMQADDARKAQEGNGW